VPESETEPFKKFDAVELLFIDPEITQLFELILTRVKIPYKAFAAAPEFKIHPVPAATIDDAGVVDKLCPYPR
jgi:hypothetical protein